MIHRFWGGVIRLFKDIHLALVDLFRIFWIIMWSDVGAMIYMAGEAHE